MRADPPVPASTEEEDPRQELAELLADVLALAAWEADRGASVLPRQPPLPAEAPSPRPEPARRAPAQPAAAPVRRAPPAAPAPPATRVPPAAPAAPAAPVAPAAPATRAGGPLPERWQRLATPGGLLGSAPEPSELKRALRAAVDLPEAGARLAGVRQALGDCQRCGLCAGRRNIVFGVGDPSARLVVLGEGPGEQEDLQGEPFVGPAGQMLDQMLARVLRVPRPQAYIMNLVKCRPPQNRNPQVDELRACRSFFLAQLASIRPDFVLVLGSVASTALWGEGINKARGKWHELAWPDGKARAMPTFHPAYLLRKPEEKRKTLEDLQLLQAALEAR